MLGFEQIGVSWGEEEEFLPCVLVSPAAILGSWVVFYVVRYIVRGFLPLPPSQIVRRGRPPRPAKGCQPEEKGQ